MQSQKQSSGPPKTSGPKSSLVQLATVSSLGIEMVVAVGFFTWLGKLGDERYSMAPALTLAGFIFGTVVAIYLVINTVKRLNQLTEKAVDKMEKNEE